MMKYQITVNHKKLNIENENKRKETLNYNSFKGMFDNIDEGISAALANYEILFRLRKIDIYDFHQFLNITKIDTEKCPKWQTLFFDRADP